MSERTNTPQLGDAPAISTYVSSAADDLTSLHMRIGSLVHAVDDAIDSAEGDRTQDERTAALGRALDFLALIRTDLATAQTLIEERVR